MEGLGSLDHHIGRAGDQIVSLQQAVNAGFRYEVALLVGEAHRQFTWAETPADAYFGRASAIIESRERIKRQTIEYRRLQHRKLAA